METAEPVTTLTDYLLAAVYLIFAWKLFLHARVARRRSVWWAAAAFVLTAAAAVFGGSFHWMGGNVLWKLTVYCMGLASFCLVVAAIYSAAGGAARRWLMTAAAVKLVVYLVWITRYDDFRYVIYDYVVAMMVTLALAAWANYRHVSGGVIWIAAAILVTFAASAVQHSGLSLHRHFNHNDLFHVIQMGAAWLFYRGFREFQDYRELSLHR